MTKSPSKGFLIAIEGIDQSGKRTQSRLLAKRLKAMGFKVVQLSFPIYTTMIGKEVKALLEGKKDYPPQLVHLLLSANRWEVKDRLEGWLREGYVVIVNRYIYSNFAYGAAKGLDLNWLISLDKGIPEADMVILIDIPPELSFMRKRRRRDKHEKDFELISRVRDEYIKLAKSFGWAVVDGKASIMKVHEELWKKLEPFIKGLRHA
ncbi:MAG: dTMP kinase [Nitrososphaerota archaeon]